MGKKWYEKLYRRNLVDMHITDWDESFLSKFDINEYFEMLKLGKVQSPMIYLQSHTGLSHHPTQTGRMHNALKENPYKVRDLIEKCKAGGMTPVGYYSLIHNTWAEDAYPQWAMRNLKGEEHRKASRYGFCCPNNPGYRVFVEEQIKEIAEIFQLDAIFFDMPFWPLVCHCDACKERFQKEYATELPAIESPGKEDWKNKDWLNFVRARQIWMGEFVKYVENISKKYMPDTTVEFNYSAVITGDWLYGDTEDINEYCEFASGDLYGDLYNHSFTCKYYDAVTKNKPFEYMTSRCDPRLIEHTVLKSEERLTREVLLTAAHHGASLIIDAIDPVGTLDKRTYERLGKVFEKQIPHERYFIGDYVSDVAVLFDSHTQFGVEYGKVGERYDTEFINKWGAINSTRYLIENHILTTVLANSNFDSLDQHKVVIAPCLEDSDNPNILKLVDYVKKGGKLILTLASDSRLMAEFFGARRIGFTNESIVYLRPTENGAKYFESFEENYPAPAKYNMPIYEFEKDVDVLACMTFPATKPEDVKRFASIHSNPPAVKTDIPCMVKASYGKGEVLWSGAAIEHDKRDSYKKIFKAMIGEFLPQQARSLQLEASKKIEITYYKADNRYIVHLIDMYSEECLDRAYCLKLPMQKPVNVFNGGTDEEMPFDYKDGFTVIEGTFKTFATIVINLD